MWFKSIESVGFVPSGQGLGGALPFQHTYVHNRHKALTCKICQCLSASSSISARQKNGSLTYTYRTAVGKHSNDHFGSVSNICHSLCPDKLGIAFQWVSKIISLFRCRNKTIQTELLWQEKKLANLDLKHCTLNICLIVALETIWTVSKSGSNMVSAFLSYTHAQYKNGAKPNWALKYGR